MRRCVVSIGIAVASLLPLASEAAGAIGKASLADLAWMAGSWVSGEDGRLSEEHWTAPAGGLMLGLHRDVRGAETAFEYLRIEEAGGTVTYYGSPQGRKATPFELVETSRERAVFANPAHDFPQRILYWLEGGSLCAAVEGPIDGETVSERWCFKPGSLR